MKKLLFLLVIIYSSILTAQKYDTLDQKVKSYPSFNDINHLAIRIQNDFTNDDEKVRAIYTWIAHNIKYDVEKFNSFRTSYCIWYSSDKSLKKQIKERELKKIQTALYTKKTLCEGYALLFKSLCNKLHIKSLLIQGLTKTDVNDISSNRYIKDHIMN